MLFSNTIENTVKMSTIYNITEKLEEINIMGTLPRDIGITENGTPDVNRVIIKVGFTNIHHLHYEKIVKQVVTIISIFLYETMLFTNPTSFPSPPVPCLPSNLPSALLPAPTFILLHQGWYFITDQMLLLHWVHIWYNRKKY